MKVINREQALEIVCPRGGFMSKRYLLAADGMGFSVHRTSIPAGMGPQHWHYLKHVEACYCVSGRGILRDLRTKAEYRIEPDMLYALDKHDDHTFEAIEDVVLISIFNPPCIGTEVHGEDGSYDCVAAFGTFA
jgi:L-ectoine synthase